MEYYLHLWDGPINLQFKAFEHIDDCLRHEVHLKALNIAFWVARC